MTSSTSTLTFPHPKLTPIIGTPNNTALKHLTKELYANARAIPSTRGGGGHGHLGLVMPAAEYMVVTGVAFQLPAHPGPGPVHIGAPNAATRQETIRAYDANLKELMLATTVKEEIKKQLLEAVDRLYLATLDDDTFGFAEVSIAAMIAHLRTNYGPITRSTLETNRASITSVWTPDDPIETLWERLREIQRISVEGGDPLTDSAIRDLTFIMFETTGVFTTACDTWRIKPVANQTLIEFRQHFTDENKERLRKLTVAQLGYHSANATATLAQLNINDEPTLHSANAASIVRTTQPPLPIPRISNNATPHVITDDGIQMFYCWTHGLGFNRTHTSATCANPSDGHCISATATNMQGGKNTIQARGYRRRIERTESKA